MSKRVFNFGGLRKKYVKRKKKVGVQNKPPPHNAIMKNANALKYCDALQRDVRVWNAGHTYFIVHLSNTPYQNKKYNKSIGVWLFIFQFNNSKMILLR